VGYPSASKGYLWFQTTKEEWKKEIKNSLETFSAWVF